MLLRIDINQIDHFYNETLMEVVFLVMFGLKEDNNAFRSYISLSNRSKNLIQFQLLFFIF